MNATQLAGDVAEKSPELTATRAHLSELKGDALIAWRMANDSGRPTPDERNMQSEFPMGWFAVCYSDELAPGQVKAARYFATDIAIWRGEDGKARVIDAYCAHYGANLAVGGVVSGNLLECPFHAWRWEGDGSCKEIPYSKSIPPKAKRKDCIPSWPVAEVNGMVHVWYHPEKAEPLWECADFSHLGVGGDDFTPFVKHQWLVYVAGPNQADNGVDIAHFRYVHGTQTVPEYDFKFEGHTKTVTAYPKLETPRGIVEGVIDSFGVGPGQGYVRFGGICDTILVPAIAPVDRDINHIRFGFTQPIAEAEGKRAGVARAIIKDICSQLDQDKVILDQMRNVDQPLICEGDGPFARQSAWYRQFYVSESRKSPMAA
jgi:3-ketosteroid 9alpha-monooxygenase subunit A